MSESISGSVNPPALPTVSFSLEVYGSAARRIEKDLATRAKEEAQAHRAKLRRLREENEMLAAEYSKIMMERHIQEALDPATDPKLRRDLRNDVMNRGNGRVRDAESDDDAKKKQGPAGDLFDFLTAISSANKAALGHTLPPAIERDITPDVDLSQFIEGDDDE